MNLLHEIFLSLRQNKLRTTLTGLSVAWGIFILILLLGAGNGLRNGVMTNFSSRAKNTVQIWSGRTSKAHKGLKPNRNLSFTEKEMQRLEKNLTANKSQTGVITRNLSISYKGTSGNYTIKGVHPSYSQIYNMEFLPNNGRFINLLDLKHDNKVIVLDKKIEKSLFGKESGINKNVNVGGIMFKVIGINTKVEQWGGTSSYAPFTVIQRIYNPNKKFSEIAMVTEGLNTKAKNDEFDKAIRNEMAQALTFDKEDKQALWINNSFKNYLQTMKIFGGINIFVSIIGIFTLIAGIVGVSNIMLVSVKERTREIGIRKALGASPASILRSIVIEAILITAIFGYVGMMLGIGVTELVSAILAQGASIDPTNSGAGFSVFKNPTVELKYVFTSTLILIVAGAIAGYAPAKRATRISPIEAMREE